MAESVRELVVVLSMEAGTFSKTCRDINQQIKGVEAEFNNITAGAGSWTDTMAGRKAKMDALTETLDLQKTKVATIAAELEKAKEALAGATTDTGKLQGARNVTDLEKQLNNAEAAAKNTQTAIEALNQISLQKLGSTLETFGGNLQRFGRKFSLYIGGPLSALGIKSFNLAKDYETAMADIQIATKQTDDEMVVMYDTVKDMSEVRPAGFIETAGVMGSLARAGLAGDVLERVTGYMLDLAATSDIDAEGAASGVIKFLNATEGGVDNIDRFSSALLWLGNEGVSTTGEIFDMSQRMAATGSLAGFSTTQILALASGFASMGIESQAGGSAMSKLMKKMQLANEVGGGAMKEFAENTNTAGMSVRDIQLAADDSDWVKGMAESMNKTKAEVKDMVAAMVALDGIASASGLSAEAFMAGWSKDPGNAALAFFEGLHQAALSGDESVLQLLDTLGITEVRMSNLTATAAKNPDLFRGFMAGAEEAYGANTELAEAAAIAYDTMQSKQDMALNAVENAGANVGVNVGEALQPVIEKIGELATEFGKLDETTQSNWVKVAGALVLLGPAAAGIGGVAKGVGSMVSALVKLDADGVTNWSKLIGFFNSPIGGPLAAAVAAGGAIFLMDQYLTSISGNTTNIINGLKNIEIGLDEAKYKETSDAIKEIQAQADALSGKTGEYNANVSAAVVAGYGTQSMYGTALGYQARLSEQEIADIAGQYAAEVDRLNAAIGAAISQSEQAALAAERDRVQGQWDADAAAAKQHHMDKVSALVSGMMAADPAAKAALEQAAKDYDVIAALTKAQADVMKDGVTPEQTDAIWKNFFTPEIMAQYFAGLKYEDLVPGTAALDLENKLVTGLSSALTTAGGESSLAYTLLQGILDNPLTADAFDATKVSGALDGIVELLDFKTAGETAGTDYGAALTTGLADELTAGTELATTAATTMAEAVDTAFTTPLGIESPSTLFIQHGLDTVLGLQEGILEGIPVAASAMTMLGEALTAIAAAQGARAGTAYGTAFSMSASAQLSFAMAQIKRELDQLNIRINRGYGSI